MAVFALARCARGRGASTARQPFIRRLAGSGGAGVGDRLSSRPAAYPCAVAFAHLLTGRFRVCRCVFEPPPILSLFSSSHNTTAGGETGRLRAAPPPPAALSVDVQPHPGASARACAHGVPSEGARRVKRASGRTANAGFSGREPFFGVLHAPWPPVRAPRNRGPWAVALKRATHAREHGERSLSNDVRRVRSFV